MSSSRAKAPYEKQSKLDKFIGSSSQTSSSLKPLEQSQEIRDRGSIFRAAAYRASSVSAAQAAQAAAKELDNPPTHAMAAWRCMVLKGGHTGLEGPDDFMLVQGSTDDGERWGGGRILKIMQAEAVVDAVVVVSRWYGGTMLGPARFDHIETCTREVCRTFKRTEELEECIASLETLDDLIADLREELAGVPEADAVRAPGQDDEAESSPQRPQRRADYSALMADKDVKKARRLVTAREKNVESLKRLVSQKQAG